ncbi:MAG: YraN family protein [Verrucomicrobiota bacterium]
MRNSILRIFSGLRESIQTRHKRTERQKLGDAGESLAAQYLKSEQNYTIVKRNWRQGRHELDIVAKDGPTLVFIEVRARKKTAKVSGYQSITKKKKESLREAIRAYLNCMSQRAPNFRFDIVEIAHSSCDPKEVRHFKSIPLFHRHFF